MMPNARKRRAANARFRSKHRKAVRKGAKNPKISEHDYIYGVSYKVSGDEEE